MIYIKKKKEPNELLWYRNQKNARFDDMDGKVKDKLRESLLQEQGQLCAYCMKRIKNAEDVKIEHLKARTPENELRYDNLLAVCRGGENGPVKARCCDTRKGNRPLSLSPLKKEDMNRIYYTRDGKIHSSDTAEKTLEYTDGGRKRYICTSPDRDLSDCLNLNYEYGAPMIGRKATLKQFQKSLHLYHDKKSLRDFLRKMKQHYDRDEGSKEQYVGILLWYINDKLSHL